MNSAPKDATREQTPAAHHSDGPATPASRDDEIAKARAARWATLPPRVRPDEMTEETPARPRGWIESERDFDTERMLRNSAG